MSSQDIFVFNTQNTSSHEHDGILAFDPLNKEDLIWSNLTTNLDAPIIDFAFFL